NRSRNSATKIDVEARSVSLLVSGREAGEAGVDAAQHRVPTHGSFQSLRVVSLQSNRGHRNCNCNRKTDQEAGSKVHRKELRLVLSRFWFKSMITIPVSAGLYPWSCLESDRRDRSRRH